MSLVSQRGSEAPKSRSQVEVEIVLANGERAVFRAMIHGRGQASVKKDAGDDPDITDGIEVFADVKARSDRRFAVRAGEGVGTVTKEGLAIKKGSPAVNPVPLRQIKAELRSVMPAGAEAVLSIPAGEQLAARTFNPRLGIIGGLSILGTTGRIEPWSRKAYQESLLPQLDVALAAGIKTPVLVPGAKADRAALKLGFSPEAIVQTGNYFGMMLSAASERRIKKVILVGHASKLGKLARGDFDTHSRKSPPPLDLLAECAIATGFSQRRAASLMLLPTTEAVLARLERGGNLEVIAEAARRVAVEVHSAFGIRAEVHLTDGSGKVRGRHG